MRKFFAIFALCLLGLYGLQGYAFAVSKTDEPLMAIPERGPSSGDVAPGPTKN
jgi:hypothetical protein